MRHVGGHGSTWTSVSAAAEIAVLALAWRECAGKNTITDRLGNYVRSFHSTYTRVNPRSRSPCAMADEEHNLYDEIEIEDCFYDAALGIYHHPCPCGDRFEILVDDMRDGEDIARCPSCSLMIRIIFDPVCAGCDRSRGGLPC